jgi:hypothetical protein
MGASTFSGQPINNALRRDRLGERLSILLHSLVGHRDVFHLQRTHTKVDVGFWTGKRRVWCCLLDDELLVFASGRTPSTSFVERIPFGEVGESQYNHITGEIVLAPIQTARIQTLKVAPLVAAEILTYIRKRR